MTTFDTHQSTITSTTGRAANDASLVEPGTNGWFGDPRGEHRLRYFDGQSWTNHVTHGGPTPCHGCR